ncbi:hypothetical protein IJ531_07285 [bacterium]|nr:hypothetical protein [bacterium]
MGAPAHAFSLIELMISLIAISVITAAFTPVISKKIKSGNLTIGDSGISTVCDTKFSSCCTLCYPHKCIQCNELCTSCSSNQFTNPDECKCYNCNDSIKGIANCNVSCKWNYKQSTLKCTKCKTGYYLKNNKCIECEAGYKCPDGINRTQCGSGTYNTTKGNTSCINCEAGYKCSGGTNHEQCSGTTYSLGSSSSCSNCEAGYKCVNGIRTQCTGTTYSLANAGSCTNCQAGYKCVNGIRTQCTGTTYSLANSSSCSACTNCYTCSNTTGICTKCNAGYKLISNNCNTACSSNEYCPAGNTGAVNCSSKWSGCVSCNLSNCTECSLGYYINGTGCTVCSNVSAGCYKCSSGTVCTGCNAGYYKNTSTNKCVACSASQYCPKDTLGTPSACSGNITGCSSCSGGSCSTCSSGYYKNTSNKCTACSNVSTGCNTCSSNSVCTRCNAGYYLNTSTKKCVACTASQYCPSGTNGTPNTCSSKITGCTSCSGSSCISCSAGYILSSGSCVFSFSTVLAGNATWSQYNAGDTNGPKIPSTVKICTAGSSCSYGSTTATCWKGTTAIQSGNNGCTNTTGYSGCNRTVCNWYAANLICAYNNMKLPTNAQFQALRQSAGANSTYTGTAAKFCDCENSSSSYSRCYIAVRCNNATSTACHPHCLWGVQSDSSSAYQFYLHGGTLGGPNTSSKQYALSVRCVK